jgi:hypothetical protein
MKSIRKIVSCLCISVFICGCTYTVTEVTDLNIPKYKAVSRKTYATKVELFLINDYGNKRAYLFGRDPQHCPYDPSKFDGHKISVAWGKRSFITDVIEVGTHLRIEQIENVSGSTMVWDRIYGRFISGRHADESVQVEALFFRSDNASTPILPRPEYLQVWEGHEGEADGVR